MIDPPFLAALRRQHRAELILLMVQLEQVVPNWWESITDLANQLGTDRSTLNHSLRELERRNLIRRASISNCGGTWVWWVKRHAADESSPSAEPAWKVKDLSNRTISRIPITGRANWAAKHGIAYSTLRSFLAGHQLTLYGRWIVQSSPLDSQCPSSTIEKSAALDRQA